MNPMNPMGQIPFNMGPPPWAPPVPTPLPLPPALPPFAPPSASFWTCANVRSRLKEVHDSLNLAKALKKELEMMILITEKDGLIEGEDRTDINLSIDRFSKFMKDNRIGIEFQESMSLNATNAIMSKLRFQLEPFRVATDNNSPWEEKSSVERFANNIMKYKRNKLWRKRKRRKIAEHIAKESEKFDQIDKEADDWRAREIAKDIAQRKVEKMKEIAKLKAKEEKKRLESELEMVLIVEKLQELRSIRIQKLKKQGHFLPEEDDKFLERVKAAVEEEERQAIAAADTDAAKDAIATAEESRRHIQSHAPDSEEHERSHAGGRENQDQNNESTNNLVPMPVAKKESSHGSKEPGSGSAYDLVANLPLEFYHYYHGSNTDMGTLIEVRRTWDAYIRPGGSRIPGHWVQPPHPADEIWASYLMKRLDSKMSHGRCSVNPEGGLITRFN